MRKAFTLVEVIAMSLLAVLVSGMLYKLFSGTWLNFFKTQTKLTNLRAAAILLEYLKHDIRLATASSTYQLASTSNSLDFQFQTADSKGVRKNVSYKFSGDTIKREEGGNSRIISHAKVSRYDMALKRSGTQTCLQVIIEVDAEKGELNRTSTSGGNKIQLSASLYPRFLQGFSDKEEEYWNKARNL